MEISSKSGLLPGVNSGLPVRTKPLARRTLRVGRAEVRGFALR